MNIDKLAKEVSLELKAGLVVPLYSAAQFVVREPGTKGLSLSMGKTKREDLARRSAFGCKVENVDDKTLFDVASLTKVISTTSLIMCAVEEGRLSLDQKIVSLVEDPLPSWLMSCTITDLLTHSTPLTAWYDFHGQYAVMQTYELTMRRIMTQISKLPPRDNPQTCCYSDLGFIILGRILENVYGETLDKLFREKVAFPLNLESEMMFRPLHHVDQRYVAATKTLYGVQLQGHADDDNARAMVHLGGHAGLFATANAVTEFVLSLKDGRFPVSQKLIDRFLTYRAANTTFALGWDRPTTADSLSARTSGDPVVGHLGYTGCSVWFDLETRRCVTLLLNRPSANNDPKSIADLRRTVYKMAWNA